MLSIENYSLKRYVNRKHFHNIVLIVEKKNKDELFVEDSRVDELLGILQGYCIQVSLGIYKSCL